MKVIVVGGSAGSLPVLIRLAQELPDELPAAVLVVLHIGRHRSFLPQLLQAPGRLPAANACDGEPIVPGRIYIAPPDHHLLVDGPALRLVRGPKEHHARPAIDPLFRSAALWQVGSALPPRYRCHTGHGFSQRSLEHTLASARDEAIWSAFRAVQENAFLLEGMAEQQSQDDAAEAARIRVAAQVLTDQATVLQELLHSAPATVSG
jgi:hypothetical protein